MKDDSGKPAKRPTLTWYWRLVGGLVLVSGAFVLLMPFGESVGIENGRCEVTSAKPNTNSGGSRGSASITGILVETADCGKISVSNGVTFDHQEAIAASFKGGSSYESESGWYSRGVLRDSQKAIPTARKYELAG